MIWKDFVVHFQGHTKINMLHDCLCSDNSWKCYVSDMECVYEFNQYFTHYFLCRKFIDHIQGCIKEIIFAFLLVIFNNHFKKYFTKQLVVVFIFLQNCPFINFYINKTFYFSDNTDWKISFLCMYFFFHFILNLHWNKQLL